MLRCGPSKQTIAAVLKSWDIEPLWRSLKQEAVYLRKITDGFQAKRIIDTWIEFYNSERPHTALDKRTPDIAYFCQAETRKAA
jgi:putative transposase